MRVTLQQISEGNEEIIIKYRQMNRQIDDLVKYIKGQGERLLGIKDGQQFFLHLPNIIYLESVEGVTYLYTEQEVYQSNLTLALFETLYAKDGFFRCSKSMIINIYRIRKLKSMAGNRIDAAMDNDEHVLISRHYAKEFRNILKEDAK